MTHQDRENIRKLIDKKARENISRANFQEKKPDKFNKMTYKERTKILMDLYSSIGM